MSLRPSRPILSLLTVLAVTVLPQLRAQQRPSAQELKEASRELFEDQVRRDGRVTDPGRNAMVGRIVDRLQDAVSQPGLSLVWAIVNNDTVNAWATPGGYIVVFRGLMDFADSVARQDAPGDSTLARRRSAAYVASVLAHELSHVTLQHGSDPRVSNCMARMRRTGGVALSGATPQAGEPEAKLVRSAVDCMSYSQAQESAADQMGAVYLLRENWRGEGDWSIQTMIDFFTAMDRMDRQKHYFFSPYMTSYLSSHPRPSTRVAQLEVFRGQLKLNQTRLDDALSLIANNMELDLAVSLLDSVLTAFPDLLAAKMARAAASQRRYLNSIPVQMLQVRPSVPTLQARFLENIRGEVMGDEAMGNEARRAFESLLQVDRSPVTLSNLAIIDAYGGDLAQAEQRARDALGQDPQNPELMNNLGVVLYLRRQYAGARDQFKASLDAQGEHAVAWVALPVFFNFGRALLALNDAKGKEVLEQYLRNDEKSEWAKEARRLLGQEATPASATATDPKAKPKADLDFGATADEVIAAWGQPESTERANGLLVMHYPNGRVVIVHPEKGLAGIILYTREAGQIAGVRVGDPISGLTSQARPTEVRDDLYFFQGDGVTVIAKVRNDVIVQLAMTANDD